MHKEFLLWAQENSRRLNLEYWFIPCEFPISGFHYATCRIKTNEGESVGAGAADSEELALTKALTEAFERTVLYHHRNNRWNSNGIAAHTDFFRAAQNSTRELIERDKFLCHYFTRRRFRLISKEEVYPHLPWFARAIDEIISSGACLFLGEMRRTRGLKSCVVVIIDSDSSCHIGTSAHLTLAQSLESAFLETVRGLAVWRRKKKTKDTKVLTLKEFLDLKSVDVADHGSLALSGCLNAAVLDLFPKTDEENSEALQFISKEENLLPLVSISSLDKPYEIESVPLVFTRAESISLQNIFWTKDSTPYLNMVRLSSFADCKQFSFEDVQNLPHPLD